MPFARLNVAVCVAVCVALGLLASAGGVRAQAGGGGLEAAVDSVMAAWDGTHGPGAVVAYVDRGETAFAKAYGLANLEHRIVMTTGSVLDLGSVAKQFTGFALALLAEQGRLSLDDDIRTYLPDVPDFGTPITIRHLLTHTSGLREVYTTLSLVNWLPGDGLFQENAATLVAQQEELQFAPGSQHLYNNTGFMLLADIVEAVTGEEFHDWMATTIFEPLGMTNTTIMHTQGQVIPGAATSYARGADGTYRQAYDNSTVQGAGGIYSTVEDLGRWMRNFAVPTVGSAATIDALTTRGVLTGGDTLSYALGLNVGTSLGPTVWTHGGASAGYRSMLLYVPEHDRGFVVLMNTPSLGSPVEELMQVFLGDLLTIPDEEPADEEAEREAYPVADPRAYVGRYLSDELEAFYEVTLDGDTLTWAHRWLGEHVMEPVDEDTFALEGSAALTFTRDATGAVDGVVLDSGRTTGVVFRRLDD